MRINGATIPSRLGLFVALFSILFHQCRQTRNCGARAPRQFPECHGYRRRHFSGNHWSLYRNLGSDHRRLHPLSPAARHICRCPTAGKRRFALPRFRRQLLEPYLQAFVVEGLQDKRRWKHGVYFEGLAQVSPGPGIAPHQPTATLGNYVVQETAEQRQAIIVAEVTVLEVRQHQGFVVFFELGQPILLPR